MAFSGMLQAQLLISFWPHLNFGAAKGAADHERVAQLFSTGDER